MGVLRKLIDLEKKQNPVQYFKDNSMYFLNQWKTPTDVLPESPARVFNGQFYFWFYRDESNWMNFSPVFFVDMRKFNNRTIYYAINMNFLPLDVRVNFFDFFITNLNDETQMSNKVTFKGAYENLLIPRFKPSIPGFEYALVEYDATRIVSSYRIPISLWARFIYSQHPKNIYDPNKLYEIWFTKLKTKQERHQAIMSQLVEDYFDAQKEINEEASILKGHIQRLRRNDKKFRS